MQVEENRSPQLSRQAYVWRVRLRVSAPEPGTFGSSCAPHPLPLVAGVVVVLYVLAAIFAPQVTGPRSGQGQPAPAPAPARLGRGR
jgi:hypothetical protein